MLDLLQCLNQIPKDGVKVVAVDGRAASGKTTLAELLSSVLNAETIHMDDFFLPLELRTQGRLLEAGGNIHYERFCEEVLPNIAAKEPFSYGVFDCSRMEMCGKKTVGAGKWRIVEGSYSHHPKFGDYADLRVFCSVESEEQMKRIVSRNGERMAMRFKEEWIPMEEKYFSGYSISESADIEMQAGKCYRGNTDI
jgi:uridine kinase